MDKTAIYKTEENEIPGNAAPQSGRTMGMDGGLRKGSPKGIGGNDSGFLPVVGRSGERLSQKREDWPFWGAAFPGEAFC